MSSALSPPEIAALFPSAEDKIAPRDFHIHCLPVIQSFQDEANQKLIISHVNKLLSTATSRDVGFKYLNLLIFCCNSETLTDNVTTWFTLGIGQNKGSASSQMLKFITNIIPLCNDIQDFNKLMVSSRSLYLNKIIDMCVSVQVNSVQVDNALDCLEVCLQTYASTCITMKTKIEQFLMKFLDNQVNEATIKRAGRCYHYLQQTGGAGPEGINHIKNWTSTLEQLCNTVQSLYDSFLEDLTEFECYDRPNAVAINFPSVPSDFDNTQILSAVENRLKNVMGFLRAMLETKYPVPKVIIPKCVFDVIKRGLSVHVCAAGTTDLTISTIQFNGLLMRHQIDSLHLLRSYMASLQSNLIPFSTIITKLLLDCLARTSACTCFSNYSKYKETIYKVLTYWITLIKNNLNTAVHEKLLSTILEDITPIKSDLSLNITSPNKSKANKNRPTVNSTETPGLKDFSQHSLDQKEIICCKALDCLINVFKNVHVSLKPNTLMLIYSTIIKAILKKQSGTAVPPYRSSTSEVKLYEAMLAMVDTANNIAPPPLEMAINVFVRGQTHRNYSVVQVCSMGLNILEKICQPICPTLSFPVLEYECEQEARMNKKADLRETAVTEVIATETVELEINGEESEAHNNIEPEGNAEQNGIDSEEINEEALIQLINEENDVATESIEETLIIKETASVANEERSLEIVIRTTQEDTIVLSGQSTSEADTTRGETSAIEGAPQAKKAKLDESTRTNENGMDQCDDEWMNSFVDVVVDY